MKDGSSCGRRRMFYEPLDDIDGEWSCSRINLGYSVASRSTIRAYGLLSSWTTAFEIKVGYLWGASCFLVVLYRWLFNSTNLWLCPYYPRSAFVGLSSWRSKSSPSSLSEYPSYSKCFRGPIFARCLDMLSWLTFLRCMELIVVDEILGSEFELLFWFWRLRLLDPLLL